MEFEDPPPTDPSEEDIAMAHRFSVLHQPIAVPGADACLWCGELWPCPHRRWSDAVLRAAGQDGGGDG